MALPIPKPTLTYRDSAPQEGHMMLLVNVNPGCSDQCI